MENWKRKPSGRAIDRLTLHRSGEVVWLSFPILDRFDFLLNGFSTRLGGVSEGDTGTMNLSFSREPDRGKVRENHERLAKAMGYRPENLVFSAQTHTDHIVEAGASDRGNGYLRENCFQDVDGMMTDEPELVLITFCADCVPLLIADPRRRAIAAVHSGWRGTVEGIGEKAVRKMAERYGSDPSDLVAAIGPSICQDCYEVSGDVICRFQERYPEGLWPELYREGRIAEDGERRYQLNLQRACAENFLRAGMLPENISLPDLCTCCNPQLLFSHRASGGKRGNLAAVLMLR